MTAVTQVLPPMTSEPSTIHEVGGRFEADVSRCVVEVVLRLLGLNLWRVRLRPVAAELNLHPAGGSLSAHLSAKPLFASLPLSQNRFLSKTPRDERITLVIAELPMLSVPGTVEAEGVVSVRTDTWLVPLALRFVLVDDDHLVVAISGAVPQRSDGVVPITPIRIDAAAEFSRWV